MSDSTSFWGKKGLQLVGVFFGGLVMHWLVPATTNWFNPLDLILFFVVLFIAVLLGSDAYFRYVSPQIFTEDGRVNSQENRTRLVKTDDPRIPHMVMIPFGGFNAPKVFMGHQDLESGGGALFAPAYMVEKLEQHLIVHGRPLALNKDAVESNQWMFEALMEEPQYEHGSTNVFVCLWGEGPPEDLPYNPKEAFWAAKLHEAESDVEQITKQLSDQAVAEIARKIRTVTEARQKPDAEKLLIKRKELSEEKEGEGGSQR